ncbi:hypothetical protein KUCAC02_030622 [Chaenocephalus aceratus]|uniref:Uncharacterized protein n=1 Tax=Chaenocephalus aceratus TaxID=36190 RepID=A0ACB9XKN9_CHAAC|nr:hypothetical protein KUCAC02_030622 [Chaenocephalus aceratus]
MFNSTNDKQACHHNDVALK